MGAADADAAAVVSPVVRAQRKRRAHAQQKPPAVTPRGGAMTYFLQEKWLRRELRKIDDDADEHYCLPQGTVEGRCLS